MLQVLLTNVLPSLLGQRHQGTGSKMLWRGGVLYDINVQLLVLANKLTIVGCGHLHRQTPMKIYFGPNKQVD